MEDSATAPRMRTASSGAAQRSPMHRLACILAALCLPQIQPGAFANPQVIGQLEAGVWTSAGGLGTSAREYPLTELGRQRYESFRLDRDPSLQCIPPGMPRGFSPRSPMDFAFHGNTLTIRYETMDVVRTIAMDGDPLPPDAPHTPNGHSVGHWAGDTLVVNTRNFTDHRSPYQIGVPSGDRKHVVERYTLLEGGTRMAVEFMLEDPEYLAEPMRHARELIHVPHLAMTPFDCDPDATNMFRMELEP